MIEIHLLNSQDRIRIRVSRVKSRRGVQLLFMMEDIDLEWYDCADVCFDSDLNDIPLQSKSCYGTPVIPLEKRVPVWTSNEESNL